MSGVAATRARRAEQQVTDPQSLAIIQDIDKWLFNGAQSDTKQDLAEYIRLLEAIPNIQPQGVRFAQGTRIMEAHDAAILQKRGPYLNGLYRQFQDGRNDRERIIEGTRWWIDRLSLDTSGPQFRAQLAEMEQAMEGEH